jgi:energy-coupling factor transporter ATP-binding protein EcfA2
MTDFFDNHPLYNALDDDIADEASGTLDVDLDELCEPFELGEDEKRTADNAIISIEWTEENEKGEEEEKRFWLHLVDHKELDTNFRLRFAIELPNFEELKWWIKTSTWPSDQTFEFRYIEKARDKNRAVDAGDIEINEIDEETTDFFAPDTTFMTQNVPDYDEFARMYFARFSDETGSESNFEGWDDFEEKVLERVDKISFGGRHTEKDKSPLEMTLHEKLHPFEPRHERGSQTWEYDFPDITYRDAEEGEACFVTENGEENFGIETLPELTFRLFILHVAVRMALDLYGGEAIFDEDAEYDFLTSSHFELTRPVALRSSRVREQLEQEDYYFPAHVLDAICTSLNAGKHVILTGPPGCGKSKLAVKLAEMQLEEDKQPLVATASPAWSTNEIIGRYLPRRDGEGLEFDPGFFLRSIDQQRWLVIDELNRADIDSAFGELFSVLAGDVTDVPYRESPEGETDTSEEEEGDTEDSDQLDDAKRVRIVPFGEESKGEQYEPYHVPQDFRLLATMNDADRARLHQLSFALQRRFHIVRIEAPSRETIREEIIKNQIKEVGSRLNLLVKSKNKYDKKTQFDVENSHDYCYRIDIFEGGDGHPYLGLNHDDLVGGLQNLFAPDESSVNDFKGLVAERVAGVSVVIDTIEFVAEAIRAPSDRGDSKYPKLLYRPKTDWKVDGSKESSKPTHNKIATQLVQSFLALGISMNVIPQLEQLTNQSRSADDESKLDRTIRFIFEAFCEDGDPVRFWRIGPEIEHKENGEWSDETSEDENEPTYRLLAEDRTINDYLAEEIALQLGQGGYREVSWEEFAGEEDGYGDDDALINDIPEPY